MLSVPLFAGCALYGVFALSDILFGQRILERVEGFLKKPGVVFLCVLLTVVSYLVNRLV